MAATNKVIIANGCSHVAGSESLHSFVDYIGNWSGIPVINVAAPGGSNDRILRTTIDACLQYDVAYVIAGWSTHERMEIVYNNNWELFGLNRRSDDKKLQKLYDYMTLYCCNWAEQGIERTLTSQLSLQCFLKSQNIDYLFFNSWNCWPKNYQSSKMDIIDLDNYYEPYIAIFEKYYHEMPEHFSASYHGDHVVHKLIAKELYDRVIRQRLSVSA
jgi:hypothetical protein